VRVGGTFEEDEAMTSTAAAIGDIDIDFPTAGLLRPVSADEVAAYHRDGAAIVKGILPAEWIEFMRAAVKRIMDLGLPCSQNYADDGGGRFFSQTFPWMFDDAFKAWATRGPIVDVAAAVISDPEVIFFFDQIFAKEAGSTKATPWHQDFPFVPMTGDQMLRIWVPMDTVSADGGAIHYLRGSHRWDTIYHPLGFKDIPEITDAYTDSPYADWPDFEADYDSYDWLVAEAEPGDLLLHHPMTIHGSLGNRTANDRRAVTSFYVGSSTIWNPHSANMFGNKSLCGHVTIPDLTPGGPVECAMFPRVSPR
jgi:ectoine hydroxylase-related dioxygenase (phytanoyl-CoA dioxygenase family)